MAGEWEMMGGRPGGTVTALSASSDGSPTVFAATPVGVYASGDCGATWSPAGLGRTGTFVEVVLPSPAFQTDRTVFAGGRDGLYRSRDGGGTWSRVLAATNITGVAVSPDYPQDSIVLASTGEAGLLRSSDGGESWEWANLGLLDLEILAITLFTRPGSRCIGLAATASGLYRSGNGGKTWQQVWPDRSEAAVQCLGTCSGGIAFAGTEQDGLLKSANGGKTWEDVAGFAGHSVMAIACSSRGTVAVATGDGVAVSADAGERWRFGEGNLGPALGLSLVPCARGETLLAGLPDRGVARSDDYGQTWTLESSGLFGKLPGGLVVSPGFASDQTLFAFGPDDGVSVSHNGGDGWSDIGPGGRVAGLALSVNFRTDRRIYCAADSGLYVGFDSPGSWSRVIDAPATAVTAMGDMVLAALNEGVVVVSDDQGDSWSTLESVPEAGDVVALAGSKSIGLLAVTRTTDQDPVRQTLWRLPNTRSNWERWLEEPSDRALTMAISPAGDLSDGVFVGLNDSVMSPIANFYDVSGHDRTPAWRRNQVGDLSVTALAVSPMFDQDSTVLVATTDGVYLSEDAGNSFVLWEDSRDLPPMVSLVPSPSFSSDRLVLAATLGGGLWRRADRQGKAVADEAR